MNEELKKLGEKFKTLRKEQSLSLKDVENATSIRMNHIEAIEEGNADKFLSAVYMSGFMRQYANFLGLNGDQLLTDHPQAFKSESPKSFDYGIGTLEMRGSMGGGVKWLGSLIWAGVSVLVLVLAFFFAKYLGIL